MEATDRPRQSWGQHRVDMQQYQDILDNLSTGVITLDGELCVTGLNAAGQQLLEASENRSIGLHARQLVLNPDAFSEAPRR